MIQKTGFLLSLSLLLLLAACGGSNTLTKNTNTSPVLPPWYSQGFTADSSSFQYGGTAIASDSLMAIERAEQDARVELEDYIASELEDIRRELDNNGSAIVNEAAFLMSLRNAHARAQEEATITESSSQMMGQAYRGFAVATITKARLSQLLQDGLSSNSSYWETLSTSAAFKTIFE